jgi:multisubunit Na+/H+ antiporter MnhE subunit
MAPDEPVHLAVVVADSPNLGATVARAIGRVPGGSPVAVYCPNPAVGDRVAALAESRGWRATVEVVDPFSADRLSEAIGGGGATRVVVAPDAPVAVAALRSRLPAVPVRAAPAPRGGRRRRRLRRPTGLAQRATIFGLAFGFYLLLGRPDAFDLATGAVSAVVVVLLLSRVTFTEPPTLRRTVPRLGRAFVFVPYLLWEILGANVALARVLLDPRLPIDPSIEEVETDARSDLERAVLANSVTLTPGTLAVDVRSSSLVVHTLTEGSRASLREGDLRRAVRFVFRGGHTGEDGEGG